MAALVYAKVNKETLRFIRDKKQVSFDYIERIAKFPESKITLWEDETSDKLPTINQAKNGQLTRLQEAGMIIKPRFYDNGADITLTQAGRHFFDESEGSLSLTKEKIYEILVALHKEMKMPDDCFGYERRQANGVIKYLQLSNFRVRPH